MHQTIAELKASSRNNLLGHYGALIAALIVSLLIILLLNLPFRNMLIQGFYFLSIPRIMVGIMGVVVVAMIAFLLNAGIAGIHLRLARGRKIMFRDIFYPFTNQPGKFIGIGLLWAATALICLLPGLICIFLSVDVSFSEFSYDIIMPVLWYVSNAAIAAGIVVFVIILLSWSLATCLILDHPNLGVMQAIRKSRQMLKGKKRKRFLMLLSFAGWLIFSILSLFIILLWILPYLRQSMICFYLELNSEEEKQEA